MATRDDIKRLVGYLQGAFPHCALAKLPLRKLSMTIDVWVDQLHDLPMDALLSAARELSSENRDFPANPGQIRQKAFDLMEGGDAALGAVEAWGEVMVMFGMPKARRKWSHPNVEKAVKAMGGLDALGQEPIDQTASTRARFIQCYETVARRDKQGRRMLPQVREAIAALAEKRRLRLGAGD